MISKNKPANNDLPDWQHDLSILHRIIRDGFERSVDLAIKRHHLEGRPVALWQDGGIVYLHPDGRITPAPDDD